MNKDELCCMRCNHELCASRVQIFSELNQEELSKVVSLIVRKHYSKGELIILEGSSLDNLIIIKKGQVKVFRYNQEGKEQILYVFSEGDFFGEKNLLKNQEANFNVEALEDTNICLIKKNDFQELLKKFPDISLKILEELSNRLEKLESTIEKMGTRNVEARVNAVLLEFAAKYGKDDARGILIELPLSREGIANYIGLTRETVSRKMSLLMDEGTIEMLGYKKIIIKNIEALKKTIE
ncbi:MAG: Crp/Fnr family transcriptional regulator [Firmicutes bacterium HGW-Firmicutes-1]|jgi:CRP/FNR family transcriptional regulator|nr:MAG: Crp/Fnr family transcriptional regulator [Firmicutes bacterium HGW-Firmicutes-1]